MAVKFIHYRRAVERLWHHRVQSLPSTKHRVGEYYVQFPSIRVSYLGHYHIMPVHIMQLFFPGLLMLSETRDTRILCMSTRLKAATTYRQTRLVPSRESSARTVGNLEHGAATMRPV